jgi:hypothetical protein
VEQFSSIAAKKREREAIPHLGEPLGGAGLRAEEDGDPLPAVVRLLLAAFGSPGLGLRRRRRGSPLLLPLLPGSHPPEHEQRGAEHGRRERGHQRTALGARPRSELRRHAAQQCGQQLHCPGRGRRRVHVQSPREGRVDWVGGGGPCGRRVVVVGGS